MKYFKLFKKVERDNSVFLFNYYTINNQSIKLLFSKDNKTNNLEYEVDISHLQTILKIAKEDNSTIINFDSDAELLDDIAKTFQEFYHQDCVHFYAWQSANQKFYSFLVVELPFDIILYVPKKVFQCSFIPNINDLINFDNDYVKQRKTAKEALDDIVFKNYVDVLNKI